MRSRDFKSNPHLAYLLDLFRNKKRTDGRNWEEFRAFDVNFDQPSNTSIASLGRTRVMCTLGVEIATPRKSTRPGSGSIAFTMDFLPMAHPSAIESNSSDTEVEQCLVMLESLYRDTYCIDFETLCIEANKFVFEIKCALKVLDYDGGLFDCCTLAVSTALAHFRRNDVSYDPITQKLISHATDKPSIPLTIYYKPFTTTFGFIQGIEEPIMDPTLQESLLVDGFLIIGANHREEICLIYQCGNLKIEPKMIERCSDFALRNVKKLSKETDKQPT